jgi:hypothetical protein
MKINFEFDTPHGKFADALYLPDDNNFTEEQIQSMKEQRLNNWIAVVTAPSIEEPTKLEIAGETYEKLNTAPPNNAKLIQVDGVWYFKV